jgi:hypothetical protein
VKLTARGLPHNMCIQASSPLWWSATKLCVLVQRASMGSFQQVVTPMHDCKECVVLLQWHFHIGMLLLRISASFYIFSEVQEVVCTQE